MTSRRDTGVGTKATAAIMAAVGMSLWGVVGYGAVEKSARSGERSRYLLLDSRIVGNTENAMLTVGTVQKDSRNPLFEEDKPWEPRYDNVYANVIYDEQEKIYKCWYSPFIIDERTSETPREKRNPESQNYMKARPNHREMGVCYAVSTDGIGWEKPELGLVEFNGSKKNNLLMRGEDMRGMFYGPHGAGVFKDMHESDLARRYKMFARAERMAVVFSPDGVHWDAPVLCPEIQAPGDTHNNAFRDPASGKYIGITRLKTRGGVRLVGRTESSDFLNWTKAEVVFQGVSPQLQTHDMVVFPAGGVYIGLLGIMEFPRKGSDYNVKQHVELAWSPDTVTWHRIQEGVPFIGHSSGGDEVYGKMPYDWGTIFASAPIFLDDEVRIYYGACDWYFFDWRIGYLALARLRPDGWAGYEQEDASEPAVVTTVPVACAGSMLRICADVGKNGSVKVALLDKDNGELAQSKAIEKTVTDGVVKWLDKFSLENLKGKDVRLRFELNNAKLYSFNFNGPEQAVVPIEDSKEDVEKIVNEILIKQRIAQEAHKEKKLAEQRRRLQSAQEQFPGYIAQLKDADASARSEAADELAKIGLRVTNQKVLSGAIGPLVTAMGDEDMDVRDESAEALGVIASRIKDGPTVKSAVGALVKGLGDEEAEVREECAEALGRIASKAKDKTLLASAVKPLIKVLQDERQATRDYAVRALRDIGTSEARQSDKDGFVSIFDGKTLDGWHAVPMESASDWTVGDGAIVGHGSADRLSYLVWKDEHLTNFELELRYRLPGKGNTGVEIRSRPDVTGKRPFEGYHADLGHVGIGSHILGAWDFHFATRKEYPCNRGTRLVIDENGKPHSSSIVGALTPADIRPHQWNDVRIVARGNHFQFFINGKLASEFTDNAKRGRLEQGAIGLQIHDKGMRVEFKDIRLKQLIVDDYVIAEKENTAGVKGNDSMNRDRFLLLDSRIVERTTNAKLAVGTVQKSRHNPLFAEDKPWEPRFDNLYANVVYDREEDIYKCWYSPFIIDESTSNTPKKDRVNGGKFKYQGRHTGRRREMGICYAVSRDGIRWEKPSLGVVEFDGSKENNLVWRGPHGSGIFKDPRDPDPNRRYKAFFKGKMISVGFSPDGIHWSDAIACPEANVAGDTHNNAFWAPTLGEYVGITRTWAKPRGRQVARTSSKDFLKWSKAEVVLEGIENHLQTYAMPVFYYAGVYIGLPAIYNSDADRTHTELAWSPDTVAWHRIDAGTPLIANSTEKGGYDWGTAYAAAYPVFLKDEIRLYYGGCDDKHFGWRNGYFCLATLRPDGFAGYEQISGDASALIITRRLLATGRSLALSADVWENGFVRTRLLDDSGEELASSQPVSRTVTDAKVEWRSEFTTETVGGKTIRIEFELRNAKLYSFSFLP